MTLQTLIEAPHGCTIYVRVLGKDYTATGAGDVIVVSKKKTWEFTHSDIQDKGLAATGKSRSHLQIDKNNAFDPEPMSIGVLIRHTDHSGQHYDLIQPMVNLTIKYLGEAIQSYGKIAKETASITQEMMHDYE